MKSISNNLESSLKVSVLVSNLSKSSAARAGGGVRAFLKTRALQKLNHNFEILGVVLVNRFPVPKAQFPFTLADGMAIGEPISGTCVSAVPTIVCDCGFLHSYGSQKQLADSISGILESLDTANAVRFRVRQRRFGRYRLNPITQRFAKIIKRIAHQ